MIITTMDEATEVVNRVLEVLDGDVDAAALVIRKSSQQATDLAGAIADAMLLTALFQIAGVDRYQVS